MIFRNLCAATAAVALLAGCGESDDPDDNGDRQTYAELEQEVCTHATERPTELSASLEIDDVDAEADDIGETHRHFRIELQQAEADYRGFAAFDITDYGDDEFALFTSSDAELTLYDADGDELDVQPDVDDFDACPEISHQHSIELDAGLYFVGFGPTEQDQISTITEQIGDVVYE